MALASLHMRALTVAAQHMYMRYMFGKEHTPCDQAAVNVQHTPRLGNQSTSNPQSKLCNQKLVSGVLTLQDTWAYVVCHVVFRM